MFEIGNSLREARVRQQLEFAELEQATKIRARYLRALEEERARHAARADLRQGLPAHLRGLPRPDGQLYVDEYNSRFSTGEDEHREPVVARRTSNVGSHHRRVESRWVLVALAAIGAVFALVIAAWKFSDTGTQKIPNLAPDTTPAATPTVKQKEQPKPKPVTFKIYLRASHGNSWMDVRSWSVNGSSRYTGTLELGQAQRFVAKRLWINFGNPGNLSIALNGKPVSVTRGGAYLATPHGITPAA